jgi:hypothetical protein
LITPQLLLLAQLRLCLKQQNLVSKVLLMSEVVPRRQRALDAVTGLTVKILTMSVSSFIPRIPASTSPSANMETNAYLSTLRSSVNSEVTAPDKTALINTLRATESLNLMEEVEWVVASA